METEYVMEQYSNDTKFLFPEKNQNPLLNVLQNVTQIFWLHTYQCPPTFSDKAHGFLSSWGLALLHVSIWYLSSLV